MATLPTEAYMKLANTIGPFMTKIVSDENQNFNDRLEEALPEGLPKEKKEEYLAELKAERINFLSTTAQWNTAAVFRAPLVADEVNSTEKVQIDSAPPEIPHIRLFKAINLPAAPRPKEDPNKPKPPAKPKSGTGNLILD